MRIVLLWVMLVFIVGGQWGVLQSIAWARMLIEYSRTNSIEEAVTMTFDGDHPCSMCKKLEKTLKHQPPADSAIKVEIEMNRDIPLWDNGVQIGLGTGQPNAYPFSAFAELQTRTDSPPSPVPLA